MTKNNAKETGVKTIGAHWASVEGKPLKPSLDIPRRVYIINSSIQSGGGILTHSHERGQLLFLTEGLVEARIIDPNSGSNGIWTVPPHRAVWIPPYIEHEIHVIHAVKMSNVYISVKAASALPKSCQVMSVSNLLRELIISISTFDPLYDESGACGRIVDVFLDQLNLSEHAPLHLPMPNSKALLKITKALLEQPESQYSMLHWQNTLGLSSRTIARRFLEETNMTYSQWRQQATLLKALQRIAQGDTIANISLELGYQSQSAFISMFKKALGKTPKKYFLDH
jgi:AraC-like DNA-binding protein